MHKAIMVMLIIAQVEMVDQNPIGKSSRSNRPYIKAYDEISDLFSQAASQ
jgi:excinuclease ABC subunit A